MQWGERWRRNASSLHWWVRKAGVFRDESRKRGLSARGQGGSVAGDTDNLSQRRPLAALCPDLCGKWGETGRYLPPPLLLLLLGTRLLSHSVLPTLCALWSGSGILFPSSVFWCYFPFVYISFCAACETSENGAFRLLFGGFVYFSALLFRLKFYFLLLMNLRLFRCWKALTWACLAHYHPHSTVMKTALGELLLLGRLSGLHLNLSRNTCSFMALNAFIV